jgi:large subunit ribosomal protein L4
MAGVPVLDPAGKNVREIEVSAEVFGVEVRPHLVHETVRAEMAAARSATRGVKTRGMVAGGAAKPWRQKGSGKARQGTTRAPQWTGGGAAFPTGNRNFDLKVNRKARKAALRSALSAHASRGTVAVVDGAAFAEAPSTRAAAAFVGAWGAQTPLLVVVQPDEMVVAKSFRNLPKVIVLDATRLEVAPFVWARSLLVSESALGRIQEVVG